MNKKLSLDYENKFWNKNFKVFGVDEVGRGSFAGPLVGSAVSFNRKFSKKWLRNVNDSKLLTKKQRSLLSEKIKKNSVYFTETINVGTINKIGIGKSNSLLFKRLTGKISGKYQCSHFLIDGRRNIKRKNTTFIVKGDSVCISIAAASIVAKVYRDELMEKLEKRFPGYNFSKNKGYGTLFHRRALKQIGMSKIHRTSFNLSKFL